MGLVDRFCETEDVLETAIGLAERLACAAPAAVAMTKAMLSRLPLDLDTLLAWEVDTQPLLLGGEDFREGRSAFMEKRTPDFTGR